MTLFNTSLLMKRCSSSPCKMIKGNQKKDLSLNRHRVKTHNDTLLMKELNFDFEYPDFKAGVFHSVILLLIVNQSP